MEKRFIRKNIISLLSLLLILVNCIGCEEYVKSNVSETVISTILETDVFEKEIDESNWFDCIPECR